MNDDERRIKLNGFVTALLLEEGFAESYFDATAKEKVQMLINRGIDLHDIEPILTIQTSDVDGFIGEMNALFPKNPEGKVGKNKDKKG